MTPRDPVHQLIYSCAATRPVGHESDHAILRVARARNVGLGLTGFLARDRERFIQLLEGPRPAVETVMAAIARDDRCSDIETWASRTTTARAMHGWSMGYALLKGPDRAELEALRQAEDWTGLIESFRRFAQGAR